MILKINWRNPIKSILGPDSLMLNLDDARHLFQRIRWTIGIDSPPKLDRWAYWEKFDYWAVYWGLPLLAITGIMLKFPLLTTLVLPGWVLNIFALLHRAEAILAASYIFIVHFFIGHLRPSCFPMNEAMFSGSVHLEEALKEKPAWVERLELQGTLKGLLDQSSPLYLRIVYHAFGFAILIVCLYLLVHGLATGGQLLR